MWDLFSVALLENEVICYISETHAHIIYCRSYLSTKDGQGNDKKTLHFFVRVDVLEYAESGLGAGIGANSYYKLTQLSRVPVTTHCRNIYSLGFLCSSTIWYLQNASYPQGTTQFFSKYTKIKTVDKTAAHVGVFHALFVFTRVFEPFPRIKDWISVRYTSKDNFG